VNLEQLLTSPEGFCVDTASDAQRAICRIISGEPLEELATPTVAEILGGPQAMADLPAVRPRLVCLGAAVRCGKSTIVAAAALVAAYMGDCSGLKPGEVPRVTIVSVKLDQAAETYSKLVGAITQSPSLSALLIGKPTADSVKIRNHSGWPVEIKLLAGARAGQNLISKWLLGAIFDEAPRMLSQQDGVVNLDDALTAIQARMRPGAQIFLVGSLWAPRGTVFDLVQERFGKPGKDAVVIVANGPQLRPALYTPEYCERIRLDNDQTYESDVMSRFADPEDALFSSVDVAACRRKDDALISFVHGQQYIAVMDPATRGNGWTLVVMTQAASNLWQVVLAKEWVGSRQAPLRASEVLREMAEDLLPYELFEVFTDQWGFDLLQNIAELAETGLVFTMLTRDDSVDGKRLETLLGMRQISLPENRQLRADLIALKKKPRQQGGFQIIFARTADGRHCDYGAAVLLAMQVLPDAAVVKPAETMTEDERLAIEMMVQTGRNPYNNALDRMLSA
jgi:hypothetical protein